MYPDYPPPRRRGNQGYAKDISSCGTREPEIIINRSWGNYSVRLGFCVWYGMDMMELLNEYGLRTCWLEDDDELAALDGLHRDL